MNVTIERFEKEHLGYHGISAERAVQQVRSLRALEDHAGVPITEVSAEQFKAYLSHLLDGGLAPTTIRKRVGMIRPYFGWAFDVGLIDGDRLMSIQRVQPPRVGRSTPKPYSQKELRQFWADLDKQWPYADEKFVKRFKRGTSPYRRVMRHGMRIQIEAIVHLALHCGLRRQEIYFASLDDIHPDNFYVVVRHAKRENDREEKAREVPFTKPARVAIERWLAWRKLMEPDHDFPWLSLDYRTIDTPMRWNRMKLLMGKVGSGYSLHRFRHTCATEWLRAGVELEKVQRLLGHANLQQTLAYAELVRDDIHKAMHTHEDAFAERVGNGGTNGSEG